MLNLFAFGTYRQYLELKDTLPELSPAMQQKLRHLTIVTLSESNKVCFFKKVIYLINIIVNSLILSVHSLQSLS